MNKNSIIRQHDDDNITIIIILNTCLLGEMVLTYLGSRVAELSPGGPLPGCPAGELEEHDLSGEHILHMDLPDIGICRMLAISPFLAPITYLSYPQT